MSNQFSSLEELAFYVHDQFGVPAGLIWPNRKNSGIMIGCGDKKGAKELAKRMCEKDVHAWAGSEGKGKRYCFVNLVPGSQRSAKEIFAERFGS